MSAPGENRSPYEWWGSDCEDCGNATADSMLCDACGHDKHTKPLYIDRSPCASGRTDDAVTPTR